MSEWIKLLFVCIGTVIGVYVTIAGDVRDHERRIIHIEKWSESHESRHETQLDKIDTRLQKIEITLARMAGDDDRPSSNWSVKSKPNQ